jgi:hypothetical protein
VDLRLTLLHDLGCFAAFEWMRTRRWTPLALLLRTTSSSLSEAAASVGRNPTDVDTIYLVSGRITRDPLGETRDDEGRWIGAE